MTTTTTLAILKGATMLLFFLIVIFVGTLPLRLERFKTSPMLRSLGATFAGGLFLNVALLHIMPQAAETITKELQDGEDIQVFPLAYLLLIAGFLITLFFTRVITNHSHIHEHQDSNAGESNNLNSSLKERQDQSELDEAADKTHFDAYFLTMAIYFHTLFEGIAVGVQNTIPGFLSTAVAIGFHKWADAMSMGIHYRQRKVPFKIGVGLIVGQAVLNVIAIGIGWAITSLGEMTEAVFLSISAGTFLAISTMELLGQQFHRQQYKIHKFAIVCCCTVFVSGIWFFENKIFENSESRL